VAAGIQVTKAELDNVAGSVARSLFNVMGNVQQVKAWLDTQTVEDLVGLGYQTADANLIKSAYTDLAELASVFNNGAPAHTTAHDYRVFAKRLIGVIY
jgi:hypothetical protein